MLWLKDTWIITTESNQNSWVPSVLSECWTFEPSSATGFFFFFVYIRFGPFFKYLGCLGTVDKPLS